MGIAMAAVSEFGSRLRCNAHSSQMSDAATVPPAPRCFNAGGRRRYVPVLWSRVGMLSNSIQRSIVDAANVCVV